MHIHQERRLLIRSEIESLLQLPESEVQQLIDTHQLMPIRIGRQERFDSRDLYQLIDAYKRTAERRAA